MNYGKAVEEVWEWREAFAKELEKVPHDNRAEYINKKSDEVLKKYGVRYRTEKKEQYCAHV